MRLRTTINWVAGLLGLMLLSLSCLRACTLSFVHDESMSYIYHVMPGIIGVIDFSVSNNHFLNSLLMLVSSTLIGNGEYALRTPNLLAHAFYIAGAFLLARKMASPPFALCIFLILNLNVLMLDFFSLARGYGLALGAMIWSLYFYLDGMEKAADQQRQVTRAVWCAWISVLANLSFLYFYIALVLVHLFLDAAACLRSAGDGTNKRLAGVLWSRNSFLVRHVLLLAISVFPMVLDMTRGDQFYYGGEKGFWVDTVPSVIAASGYSNFLGVNVSTTVMGIIAVTLFLSAVIPVMMYRAGLSDSAKRMGLLLLVTVACGIGVTLHHELFGTKLLLDRTALLFIPLFLVLLGACLSVLFTGGKTRLIAVILATLVAIFGAVHVAVAFNAKSSITWGYDANTRDMIEDLTAYHESGERQGKAVKLGISWVFEPTINYYRITRRLTWLGEVKMDGLRGDYDCFYYLPNDAGQVAGMNLVRVREYKPTRNVLAVRGDKRLFSPLD